ncbi:MAG: hypothetical protein KAR20_10670, partial [Candidatus Heimdallarchaeota archaeon]|nr:hypothetical protein [Candidatus Heimdallarchaeota archaeon]
MMNRAEIQKFFLLENDPQLFETAIHPRSCGGGTEFEQLAMYGDLVIDMHLLDYLISEGLEQNGDITKRRDEIHQKNIIKAFADDLGIPDILTPVNLGYQLQNKELAETVEALIGAAFEVNGLDNCYPIIFRFAKYAIKEQKKLRKGGEFDKAQNYIEKLNELFDQNGLNRPYLEPTRIGGEAHSPIFQYEGDITFDGIKHKISTRSWSKKKEAEQEAAYLTLLAITGNNPEYKNFNPTSNITASQEKTVHPITSIDDEELIFRKHSPHKPALQYKSMEVDHNTGELLVDWMKRKAKKNVFGMLILLSARIDNVSGASWVC